MMIRTRALIQVPIIVGLSLLAFTCFKWSLADIYATQVNYIIDKEDDSAAEANILSWQRAKLQLQNTLLLRPQHPQYLELAENFYQTLYSLEADAPDLLKALTWHDNETTALQYAQQALLLRPSWPYLWNELAVSKITLNQFDNELTAAIERATTLGPWQQSIQYQIALSGLDTWDSQEDKTRQIIVKAVEQSMAMNEIQPYRHKLEVLLGHEKTLKMCGYVKEQTLEKLPVVKAYCIEKQSAELLPQ
jgi:hypothetical protein